MERMKTLNFMGAISNTGKLLISEKERLDEICKSNKGAVVSLSISIYEPKSSPAIRGYYFNKIVPDFQLAFREVGERLSLEETERKMREMSMIMWDEVVDENTGKYSRELKEVVDCSNREMSEYIEHLKQIAAENFSFYIGEPNEY